MLDEQKAQELSLRLYELRDKRIVENEPAGDLNDLIADIMNGLETLFVIINAGSHRNPSPQGKLSRFTSVSNPDKPQML